MPSNPGYLMRSMQATLEITHPNHRAPVAPTATPALRAAMDIGRITAPLNTTLDRKPVKCAPATMQSNNAAIEKYNLCEARPPQLVPGKTLLAALS
jgi:hypothetical protein